MPTTAVPTIAHEDRFRELRRTLLKALRRLTRENSPRSVHLLRTSCRRLEAIAAAHGVDHDSAMRRMLRKFRRKTNRLRDYDVQLAALHTIHRSAVSQEKRAIVRFLEQSRSRQGEKLRGYASRHLNEVRAALRKFSEIPAAHEKRSSKRLDEAIETFREGALQHAGEGAQELHAFRIACKRARYLAEMAPESARARTIKADLELLQDALGDWRDWELLIPTAENVLGATAHSPLMNAIAAQVHARYEKAMRSRHEVTTRLLHHAQESKRKAAPMAVRKAPQRASTISTATRSLVS